MHLHHNYWKFVTLNAGCWTSILCALLHSRAKVWQVQWTKLYVDIVAAINIEASTSVSSTGQFYAPTHVYIDAHTVYILSSNATRYQLPAFVRYYVYRANMYRTYIRRFVRGRYRLLTRKILRYSIKFIEASSTTILSTVWKFDKAGMMGGNVLTPSQKKKKKNRMKKSFFLFFFAACFRKKLHSWQVIM